MQTKQIKRKNISENWVEKTMTVRFKKPIYISSLIVILVFSFYIYDEYEQITALQEKHDKVIKNINDNKNRLNIVSSLINKQSESIEDSKAMLIDDKQPLLFLTKVCDLLKDKELIGSYYISKRKSKKFKNVIIFEVKISYGDKDMLKTIANMILDKLFYVKDISVTKTGIKCELYKPIK